MSLGTPVMPRIPSVSTGVLKALAMLFGAPAAAQSLSAAEEAPSLRPLLVGGRDVVAPVPGGGIRGVLAVGW